jgi:hypothetical protein
MGEFSRVDAERMRKAPEEPVAHEILARVNQNNVIQKRELRFLASLVIPSDVC